MEICVGLLGCSVGHGEDVHGFLIELCDRFPDIVVLLWWHGACGFIGLAGRGVLFWVIEGVKEALSPEFVKCARQWCWRGGVSSV